METLLAGTEDFHYTRSSASRAILSNNFLSGQAFTNVNDIANTPELVIKPGVLCTVLGSRYYFALIHAILLQCIWFCVQGWVWICHSEIIWTILNEVFLASSPVMFDGTFCITFVFAIFLICCDVGPAWYTFLPCVICIVCIIHKTLIKPQVLNFGITFCHVSRETEPACSKRWWVPVSLFDITSCCNMNIFARSPAKQHGLTRRICRTLYLVFDHSVHLTMAEVPFLDKLEIVTRLSRSKGLAPLLNQTCAAWWIL